MVLVIDNDAEDLLSLARVKEDRTIPFEGQIDRRSCGRVEMDVFVHEALVHHLLGVHEVEGIPTQANVEAFGQVPRLRAGGLHAEAGSWLGLGHREHLEPIQR